MAADDYIKVLQQFVKPRYVAAVLLATTFLVYTPYSFFVWLEVSNFISKFQGWFLIAWALSAGLTLVYIGEEIHKTIQEKKIRKERIQYLHQLTVHEREILSGYISKGTKTRVFRRCDGVVQGLIRQDILHIASATPINLYEEFDFNISQWAWDYLNTNPKLRDEPAPPLPKLVIQGSL